MADVTMPQLGETVTEGTITKWFKNVGDAVAIDEVLFEVSTDKVDSEVTAVSAGFLSEIKVPEGETVNVGVVLAVISTDVGAAVPASEPLVVAPVVAVVEPAAAVVEDVAPVPTADPAPEVPAPPRVIATAAALLPEVPLPGSINRLSDLPGMDKVLSPVVRKLIHENDLDPGQLVGTGLGGRITREDVLAVIDAGTVRRVTDVPVATPVAEPLFVPAADPEPTPASVVVEAAAPAPATPMPAAPAPIATTPVAPAPIATTPVAPAPIATTPVAPTPVPAMVVPVQSVAVTSAAPASTPALRLGARDEVVAFNNIRRRTGEHMLMSLHTSPHAFIAVEVDYSSVDKLRAAKKEAFKADEGFSLTYMPFIARAVVDAIRVYPNANASVVGDQLIVHHGVNLGVAVDLDFNGLMVPVVRDADGKRMRAIARDISDVANRTRTKKLTPDDISGGTFTLSNAGPYGIDLMQSVINQPQVAILSITSVTKKPVVITLPDGTDTIGIRPMGTLGLSWDHRAFDGAYAASFLAEIKKQLQTRDWSSEL